MIRLLRWPQDLGFMSLCDPLPLSVGATCDLLLVVENVVKVIGCTQLGVQYTKL